jgi:hypothetical protein
VRRLLGNLRGLADRSGGAVIAAWDPWNLPEILEAALLAVPLDLSHALEMKYRYRAVLLLAFVSVSAGAWNTCGESHSWKRRLIPDQWGFARFSPACNNHDDCYGLCGRSKEECDSNFHNDLRDACKKAYSAYFRSPCYRVIDIYYAAVDRMGGDAYRRTQKSQNCR